MDYKAQVQINRPFSKVFAAGPETKVSREGKTVRLDTSRIHEVLVLED